MSGGRVFLEPVSPVPPVGTSYKERKKFLRENFHHIKSLAHFSYRKPDHDPICPAEMAFNDKKKNKVIEAILQFELYMGIIVPDCFVPPKSRKR